MMYNYETMGYIVDMLSYLVHMECHHLGYLLGLYFHKPSILHQQLLL